MYCLYQDCANWSLPGVTLCRLRAGGWPNIYSQIHVDNVISDNTELKRKKTQYKEKETDLTAKAFHKGKKLTYRKKNLSTHTGIRVCVCVEDAFWHSYSFLEACAVKGMHGPQAREIKVWQERWTCRLAIIRNFSMCAEPTLTDIFWHGFINQLVEPLGFMTGMVPRKGASWLMNLCQEQMLINIGSARMLKFLTVASLHENLQSLSLSCQT